MRLSPLLATCAALAAMSSVAQAATLMENSTEPGGAQAVFPNTIFPGVTTVNGMIGTGIFAGSPVVVTNSNPVTSNFNSISSTGGGSASLTDLTISLPGNTFDDLNFTTNFFGGTRAAIRVTASDGEQFLTTTPFSGSVNFSLTNADEPLTFVTIATDPASTGLQNVSNIQFTGLAVPVTPEIPLPASFPLFASGLGALCLLGWRRKRKARAEMA